MKVVFTILFFIDTLVLVVLTYLLLSFIDTGTSGATIAEVSVGIVLSIILMVLFLYRYLKTPTGSRSR